VCSSDLIGKKADTFLQEVFKKALAVGHLVENRFGLEVREDGMGDGVCANLHSGLVHGYYLITGHHQVVARKSVGYGENI
jgi:hypothetical protein